MKNLKMLEFKKNEVKSMKKSSFLFSANPIELEEFFINNLQVQFGVKLKF